MSITHTPDPKLNVRPASGWPTPETWLFLDYGGAENAALDLRWAIRHFVTRDGFHWWGVVSLFPDAPTNERSLDLITKEMELAKQAIETLKVQTKGATDGRRGPGDSAG